MSPRAAESTTDIAPGPRNWFVSWSNRGHPRLLYGNHWRTSMTQMYRNVCTCNFHKSPIVQAQLLTLLLHVEAVQFKTSLSLPRIKEVAIATLLFRFPLIGHWAPYLNASNVLLRCQSYYVKTRCFGHFQVRFHCSITVTWAFDAEESTWLWSMHGQWLKLCPMSCWAESGWGPPWPCRVFGLLVGKTW